MFLPLSDDDRALVKPAFVTNSLLVINVLVFAYQIYHPEFTSGFSAVPAEITSGEDLVQPTLMSVGGGQSVEIPQAPGPAPIYLTLITSMFMHGGFMHLGGNMLFLWIFGDNVEHRFGHWRFLGFYLISGLVASLAQIATDSDSVIPTLGASGAIAGVMGAYLVLFPRNLVMVLFFFRVIAVPAFVVIALWAVFQIVNSLGVFSGEEQAGGVAYMAHVGGLIAGVILALIARARMGKEPDSVIARQYAREPRARRWW